MGRSFHPLHEMVSAMRKLTLEWPRPLPERLCRQGLEHFGWTKLQEVQVQDISASLWWSQSSIAGSPGGGWRGCTKAARRCTETRGRRCYFQSIKIAVVVSLFFVDGAGHDDSVLRRCRDCVQGDGGGVGLTQRTDEGESNGGKALRR